MLNINQFFNGFGMIKINDLKRIAALFGVVCLVSSVHGQFTLGGINTTMGVMGTLQSINVKSGAMLGAINEANRLALRGQRPGTDGNGPIESGEVGILGADPNEPAGQPDDPFASLPDPDDPFERDGNPGEDLEEIDPDSGLDMSDDPFSEDIVPGADTEGFNSDLGLDPANDPFDANPPEDDMPGVGDKNSVDSGDSVEPPEDPENVHIAPNGKQFPTHWGAPPALQTRDLRPLPGGYGNGSSTLAGWIQQNLERDAENN